MDDNTKCDPLPAILLSDCEEGFMQDYGRVFFATEDCVKQIYKDSMVMMPEFLDMPPFSTIDRGSKNYKAGYNAAIRKVAEMNGLKS